MLTTRYPGWPKNGGCYKSLDKSIIIIATNNLNALVKPTHKTKMTQAMDSVQNSILIMNQLLSQGFRESLISLLLTSQESKPPFLQPAQMNISGMCSM
jgi:hypothetical protein